MSKQWSIVPTAGINAVWPIVSAWMAGACERGFAKYAPDDFLALLLEEKAQLWLGKGDGIEAAAITDVIQYPNKRYARVTIGMGDPTDLSSFIAAFEAWARDIGCDGVQSEMRPGFSPQFGKAGWKKTHVLMEREL